MTEEGPHSFSPELALVDPVAAEQGRDELPAVVLTEDARPPRPAAVRRRVPWVLVCVAALGVAGAAIGIRLGSGAREDNRPATTIGTTPTVGARTIPDFVWVAAADAGRYRVEFVRDGSVVLQRTTTVPRLHLAASTLPAGRYRWRVWALGANGALRGSALVDAAVDLG